MGILVGNKSVGKVYYGNHTIAAIYFGNRLIWSSVVGEKLLMGTDKYVCVEYTPSTDVVSTSTNPITISVFMNTNEFNNTTPPMWVLDEAGVVCGYSDTGVVGSLETLDGCSGYKRTNTFSDNQLYLISGKTYYIVYKIYRYDAGDNYFAYYEDVDGKYKLWNSYALPVDVQNLNDMNYVGGLDNILDVIDASDGDLFIWGSETKDGLTSGYEYYRNDGVLENYVPELNFGSTDKCEVLNHILTMDKGSSEYGASGDKFVITESYSGGPTRID